MAVNRGDKAAKMTIRVAGKAGQRLSRYVYQEAKVVLGTAGFPKPVGEVAFVSSEPTGLEVPANAVVFLTTVAQ